MRTLFIFLLFPVALMAQPSFPSLTIPASSRGLAMGDCGIASALENQGLWYNIAKTAFTSNTHQLSATYTPYLSGISSDVKFINANYLGSGLGVSLSYLDLGNMELRDDNGAALGIYRPKEFNIGASYALALGENQSIGAALRFLGSQPGVVEKNIYTASGDISYYGCFEISEENKLQWGLSLTNIGLKQANLPTNLGFGVAYSFSGFTAEADINQLIGFGDLRVSGGLEYCFSDAFFLRGGISLENEFKGNRKFIGIGTGFKGVIKDQGWAADLHYMIPFGYATVSPFQNSFGFTLSFSIGHLQ